MIGRHERPAPNSPDGDTPRYPGQGSLVEESTGVARRRRPRWLRIGVIVVAAAVVGILCFGGYWLWRLQSNISTTSLGAGGQRSEGPVDDRKDRLQILVLGSDTRSGKNSQYGTADQSSGYGQSDVMMLVDISADNNHVNVISFPRDLLVDVPACKDQASNEQHDARPGVMINSAMAEAGIGCAVDTVNKLTGLEVDHFMMADFNAVKELTTTVGGWTCASIPPSTIPIQDFTSPRGPPKCKATRPWLSSGRATLLPTAEIWAASRPSSPSWAPSPGN
ncbi:LCP family protein required for cell wall assembly [Paenarthrobacter nitroguajacolicus]|nr:LCP family protein required for cell wall assembly [Paenarthrobacter nitroguajacolicus]